MSFRYISERSSQKISNSTDIHLTQGILIREAFVIRHLEDLHVVTLQLVYKWGTFAVKIGIKKMWPSLLQDFRLPLIKYAVL